ncbi:unnamed protein product [Rhizoctonia solani]|uniref:Ubiquitin-like protease family profile domain-containing protein n=1 Tax=Rhizoctonia solani TaxID=456999 RepID=A0A8H2X6H4_9AGAM|nr:unnamed protein product [Rhizoctonia solani]
MATRNERREIAAFHQASNGQADPPHDGRKKRPREDDISGGASRRRGSSIGNPFSGIGRSNLRDHRSNAGRTRKRDSSPSITSTDSHSNTTKTPLGYAAFGPRTGVLDGVGPPVDELVAHDTQSPWGSSSIRRPSPRISKETNDKMDGTSNMGGTSEGEGTFSLAAVLGEATIPQTPERAGRRSEEPSSRARSRSSSDPINIIKINKAPHSVDNTPHSANSASHPINIDDDEIINVDPPPVSRRPASPKGTSIIQKGKVKQTTLMFEPKPSNPAVTPASTSTPPRVEGNLDKFLVPTSTQAVGTSMAGRKLVRSTPHVPVLSGGPTSKGNPIVVGATRPKASEGKISARMQGKVPAQGKARTSGLKILQQGEIPPSNHKPPPGSKTHDVRARDANARDVTLQIQEWYCDPNHYESSASSKGSYSLKFDGNMIKIIFSERPRTESKQLCLMRSDIDGFEVVDTAEDESYLWMVISLNEKALSQTHWQRVGLGDSKLVLLHFLESDDPGIHERWKALVQGMAKWVQKCTIIKSAMDSLIKRTTDRSSFHVPKIQDINDPTLQHELKTESKTRTPPAKPRTRSAVSNSNQGDIEKDTMPIIVPDSDEVVLVHPTGAGSVTINRGELARLEPGEFLNDSLIELGLKMWLNDLRLKDPNLVDQIHVFSSFFFKKLDAGRGKGCDYNSVKKWTSKFDLFSKRFIIIPINEHLHWYLAIICFPEHVLEAPLPQPQQQPTRVTRSSDTAVKSDQRMSSESDMQVDKTPLMDTEAGSPTVLGKMEIDTELASKSEKMAIDSTPLPESQASVVDVDPVLNDPPIVDMTNNDSEDKNPSQGGGTIKSEKTWILILDSLGGKHNRTVRILREYLQAEAQERHGKVVDIKDARLSGGLVEDKHLSVPVQPNWCDCGVYLLHYVEVFYANPLEIIALPPGAKRKTKEASNRYDELWRTDQVKNKRTIFREKLHQLSAEWLGSKHATSKNRVPTPGTLPPNRTTEPAPLSYLQADASIQEIDPPETRNMTAAVAIEPSGTIPAPQHVLGYPDSPGTTIKDPEGASSDADDRAVEGIVRSANPAVETSPTTEVALPIDLLSGNQPSPGSKTRRGKKSGSKHGSKASSESSIELKCDPTSSPEL